MILDNFGGRRSFLRDTCRYPQKSRYPQDCVLDGACPVERYIASRPLAAPARRLLNPMRQ
jgi:hypothetical protein